MTEYFKKYGVYAVVFLLGFFVSYIFFATKKEEQKSEEFKQIVEEGLQEEIKKAEENQKIIKETGEKIIAKNADFKDLEKNFEFLKVSDQQAGKSVSVAYAKADFPFWLVVHAEKDGKIWNALGARRKDAGEYTAVNVPLLAPTKKGKRYWVVLYKDNGDGNFSLDKDFPVLDENGNYILVSFEAK